MATPTVLEIIDGAIEVLSKRDGYTKEDYHISKKKNSDNDYDSSVSVQGAHCAIGGVEHAVWKLSSVDLSDDRWALAYTKDGKNDRRGDPLSLSGRGAVVRRRYATVMAALNQEARAWYDKRVARGLEEPIGYFNIEEVSMNYSKRDVMRLFAKARKRLAETS